MKIQESEKYLSFNGSPIEAIQFIEEIRGAYSESGGDIGRVLNDLLFKIEVALQNAGYLDDNFNEIKQ
jgi:hypothetical protein